MGKAVESCCCCIELRTGSLIIGYLNLVGYIMYIVDAMRTIGAIRDQEIMVDDEDALVASLYFAMVIMVLNVIFTLVLLYGLHGEEPRQVRAYLIYGVTIFVFEIIGRIYLTLKLRTREAATPMFVTLAVTSLLELYFLLVIQSQYFEMINPTTQSDVHQIPANYYGPNTYNPAINSHSVNGPDAYIAINSHPVNGPAMHPAINSHPVNGPAMDPAINSHSENIPANYSHPVNSPSIYPTVNSFALNNHDNYPTANSPPPYGSTNSPSHNYPTKQ